jgi:hypothetical protein
MKKINLFVIPVVFLLVIEPVFLNAAEHKDVNSVFAVDFPSAWQSSKSEDPEVVLKLEKGKAFFEFTKLDSELSEYYLKTRVKEQISSLRSKGSSISGDIQTATIHGVASLYYTSYESMGMEMYIGFFTYNAASFAISARGISQSEFKGIVNTIRKPGEKIQVPKPPKSKKVKVIVKIPEEEDIELSIEVSTHPATVEISQATAAEPSVAAITLPPPKKKEKLPPYFSRNPIPFFFWMPVIILWVAGVFCARNFGFKIENPKIAPPPKEVPPDFFFPFIVDCFPSMKAINYRIVTRQKQMLIANFNIEHEFYIAGSIYGTVFFHILWSFFAFMGKGNQVIDFFLAFPFGSFFASFPEIFFLVPLLIGISTGFNKKQVLQLFAYQGNMMLDARKESSYCLMRDGKGKEVARLEKKGSFLKRTWNFVDTDNQVLFEIKDEHPKILLYRKIFGNLNGTLKSRYGIFVQDRRAGFVFRTPGLPKHFQIHLEYNYARLAHSAQILMSILYIESKEKDPIYPSPF